MGFCHVVPKDGCYQMYVNRPRGSCYREGSVDWVVIVLDGVDWHAVMISGKDRSPCTMIEGYLTTWKATSK